MHHIAVPPCPTATPDVRILGMRWHPLRADTSAFSYTGRR